MHPTATNCMTIEPHIPPRGPMDAAVSLGIGLAIGLPYLFVAGVVAFVSSSAVSTFTEHPLPALAAWVFTFTFLSLLPSLFVVQHLRFDEEGLEFVRVLGKPGKIRWADVESVELASPAEVVLQGWLRPRFPMREMTSSMTAIGHYRIRWHGGAAYFPPRDVERFLSGLQVGRWHATRQQAGNSA